ncbi:MAG: hypothetical protein DSY80_03775 [Desulfocapsa sp.]|nr:MAG: hypothetical protein DSY80_03775 [Desulfocapsa sp.]
MELLSAVYSSSFCRSVNKAFLPPYLPSSPSRNARPMARAVGIFPLSSDLTMNMLPIPVQKRNSTIKNGLLHRRIYKKRFRIETFFSDEKSRGFYIQKSHISDPERLNRLLIAACLAYLWVVYLGTVAKKDNLVRIIHRSDRCDLSLFQLGLRLLDYLLNHDKIIPVAFKKPTWILL